MSRLRNDGYRVKFERADNGYNWTVSDAHHHVIGAGWSAGTRFDAASDAEECIERLKSLPGGMSR